MCGRLIRCAGIALLSAAALSAASPQSPNPAYSAASQYRAVLDQYCVTCHNARLRTAELLLDQASLEKIGAEADLWEKVVAKLRSGAMPPVGVRRPDPATYDSIASYLEQELDRAATTSPNPGRPALHRLNRAEYANAIRDLLAMEVNAESLLPADDASYGFDNIGDVLSVSPALLERYLAAATKISNLAVGNPHAGPSIETYTLPKRLMQRDRASEDLPFGSRGGIAVRHYFPVDGEYALRIFLERDRVLDIIGLAEPHQLDVRLDGALLKSFTVGGGGDGASSEFGPQDYRRPASDTGAESYERTADAGLELRFQATAGPHVVGVAFLDRALAPEGVFRRRLVGAQYGQADDIPGIGSVVIGGPYGVKGSGDTASRRRIFLCHPDGRAAAGEQHACARRILTALARRAYRRPVAEQDLETLIGFFEQGRAQGGFEAGIEMALRRLLVSPEFLFRIERDPADAAPGTAYPISDLELASRLSFFLWSSIPDDELLDAAEQGRLRQPGVLEQQVRRMLADSRAEALIDNFVGQWLYLRNMDRVVPDPEAFPEFDENLRNAFAQETRLFLESMLREDRPVTDLLNADYSFLNERLARHYGIPNVYGSHLRRLKLEDANRRGLVGQGSILTVTSYATRTSPTLRGKWLLENILGSPPPPPPNNVPSLRDRGEDGRILSVREQMEMHRKSPACSGCHARMDPLGFALENFDAIGRWRTTSGANDSPVDASGVLPDGTKFEGPAELRELLMSRRGEFVNTFAEKLLTYALGRGVEHFDKPAIRKILRDAAPGDYRWSAMILAIAQSTPFQMRRSPAP
jgi:mono/diheme cytochrome c family protein